MLKRACALLLASGLVVTTASGAAPLPTINNSMTHVMSIHAQTIWDTSSKAFNKRGDGLLASKVTDKDWIELGKAGREMAARARILAKSPKLLEVTGPGEQMLGEDSSHAGVRGEWDAASPKQVKAMIAANPALFADRAMNLARNGDIMAEAAKTRDIRKLYQVSSGLDEVCDGCHEKFWGTDEPPAPPRKGVPVLKK
jgi:hypothetical protein